MCIVNVKGTRRMEVESECGVVRVDIRKSRKFAY